MNESTLPNIKVSKDLRRRLDRQIKSMKAKGSEGATLAGLVRQYVQDGLDRKEAEDAEEAHSIAEDKRQTASAARRPGVER